MSESRLEGDCCGCCKFHAHLADELVCCRYPPVATGRAAASLWQRLPTVSEEYVCGEFILEDAGTTTKQYRGW